MRGFFQNRRNGVFVDVGANHYRNENNTYISKMSWAGQGSLWNRSPSSRQTTNATGPARGSARLLPRTPQSAGAVLRRTELARDVGDEGIHLAGSRRRGGSADVNDLLSVEKIDRIDFLSMDIELAEPKALAGFDLRRFSPGLVCIEAHREVRQLLLTYFHDRGYVVIGKTWTADHLNMCTPPPRPTGNQIPGAK